MAARCTLGSMARLAIVVMVAHLAAACGEGAGRSPVAPSLVIATRESAQRASRPSIDTGRFPPRNETIAFRQSLENMYRYQLSRPLTASYVDMEGAVAWIQEYLRYRVHLCSHSVAVDNVMKQIDGAGAAPVCGAAGSLAFPPNNESLDFMRQLESKYQHGLRRQAGATHVDTVGTVVWIQEFLRYRAGGCTADEAKWRVALQIFGNGVPSPCESGDGTVG